jgi:lysyl-tRNA synthetase, class II
MSRQTEEQAAREAKLQRFLNAGIDPYPAKFERTHTLSELAVDFDALSDKKTTIFTAGRLRAFRGHGGLAFATLEDGGGKFQIALHRDVLGEKDFDFWISNLDVGDFIGIEGNLFLTKRGEKTIDVKKIVLLSKALLPLPEKWHGLTDTEVRYRKRYLDLISNPEVRDIFIKRSLIVKTIRNFLDDLGFMEVETPILQPLAGGAAAKPFTTHHNALNFDMYLRVAPELYLKRLIVGGFEKVYEIARCFRNEGIDHAHNPEFTQVEFYWAYADYEDLMKVAEELIVAILEKINGGSTKIAYEGSELDFTPPFARVSFKDIVKDKTGIDIDAANTEEKLRAEIKKRGLRVDIGNTFGFGETVEALYKEYCRSALVQPTFLTDYPVAMIPLAKRRKDDPSKVATFQLVAKGVELCKAYNELNDPIDQRTRFKEQDTLRAKGAEEAQGMDDDFIEALSYGMPPTAGFGMGIDRLAIFLTGVHSIKETIFFPTLKPEIQDSLAIQDSAKIKIIETKDETGKDLKKKKKR